ncbi:glycoside hydrolase family 16 protein [Adhaeribacter radiodurans]|uniref:Glycoside hydrolase family 16 protein n=1 Tax=Adhaeribacter radiodurans TaxID=2745197 RepID=A0A7L7LA64_9BACT|nr:glycoside hydrolase family 16 protein [Adhaeribacter radiodurans]QMU29604.1 glycoside hydrolase family 16 protein [Adhaeribacter radiodurans]
MKLRDALLTILFTFIISFGAIAQSKSSSAKQSAKNKKDTGWQLVWADEFNILGRPDPKNWIFEKGFVRNQEAQLYQPENAWCEKGYLIIEGRREQKTNPAYQANSSDWRTNREFAAYTAASLTTQGKQQWQYGRWEKRGKIDIRPGMWPAFWTLGVSGEWPRNGEVDIMEYYRDSLLANAAWGTAKQYQAKWSTTKKAITSFNNPNWAQKFHVWRMDWDEKYIRLYVDGLLLNEVDLTKTINQDGSGKNPFHQPHYLLLNLAIGGTNGGDVSKTTFPARFEVDYVRVYQKRKTQ